VPSGKKARQKRQESAKRTPPPVRSKGGGRRIARFSHRTLVVSGAVAVILIGLAIGIPLALSSSGNGHAADGTAPLSTLGKLQAPPFPGRQGFEGVPVESGPDLAPAGGPSPGSSVDGISCQPSEQLVYHIHARLTVFVNGRPKRIPAGAGFADPQVQQSAAGPVVGEGTCVAWLHTHATDGIIHIESPEERLFTLGNFFAVWGQPLSRTQVGPAKGRVTVIVNRKVWLGDPRDIPLTPHAQIQLEIGRPLVAPERITEWFNL